MRRSAIALFGIAATGLLWVSMSTLEAQSAPDPQFYEKHIKLVFATNCLACHGDTARGGLRVDSREALLKGGKSGPAVVTGDPDKSLLMAAVRHTGAVKMPLGGKLADSEIADLATWIKDGLVWPEVATESGKPVAVLTEFFESHIRPVLAQQCFSCHTSSKQGGLRLDSRAGLLQGGNSGAAVVPGDPDKSVLLSAIRHSGALRMPKGGTRLPDTDIANFTAWIKDGAFWPVETTTVKEYSAEQRKLWSVQPLQKVVVPDVKDAAWPLNDIDRFVLAKLEQEGLKPGALADRRTLLRRVSNDLVGLMPSHEQVEAFEADTSPDAYEKIVDRLLASPQYGEQWARHWMDTVRYGEDDYNVGGGPERTEKYPFAYLYRDWLIGALNDDIGYDMFVKTQLAADLLDEKVRDKNIAALGMNGNGMWIFTAGPAPVERADEWHDKVDVTSKAFMGLTVGCARCHDHKFDAIYTKDYYSMASVFASSRFKDYARVPKAVADEYEKQTKLLEKKNEALTKFLDNASALYAQMLFAQTETYMLAAWKVETAKRATVETVADDTKLDPELLGRWVRFLKKKPDNYSALTPWQGMIAKKGTEDDAKALAKEFVAKVAEINEKQIALTKDNEVTLAQYKNADDFFDPLPNGKKRKLNAYQIDLKSLEREDNQLWRDVFDADVPEATADVDPDPRRRKPGLLKLTDGALERRLTADLKLHVDRARVEIDAFKKAMPPRPPFVYGIEDLKEPADLKVFVRGNPYAFGEDAARALPSILNNGTQKVFSKGSGRLELADEIVKHPISSRTVVNRLWRWHTGRGIVDTPNNLGMAGDRPSNPELLEYLASRFEADGRSWKKFAKLVVMSRMYQLSTAAVPGNMTKDPDNRFFWRANRQRLTAEGIWDNLLLASSSLDLKGIGGPSEALTEKTTRRGVYGAVSRMYPADFQTVFDAPTATISTEKRYATNVPQQRLFFLNNTFVEAQAQKLADQVKTAGDEAAQATRAFEIVLQRDPTAEELREAVGFLRRPPLKAHAVEQGGGEGVRDAEAAPPKRPDSLLRSFCWALLSSNEFLFVN
ncbi:MAG: DUF1549 domain-containing protein [Vicinamibacterales bacterium]